ncbi:cyclopropane fatty acid synthase [Ramaria rubella]|nr:cyclopropane fatty acid synthase [Ramaria rubella]
MAYATLKPPKLSDFSGRLLAFAWSYIVTFARRRTLWAFEKGIRRGRLDVFDATFGKRSFGQPGIADEKKEPAVIHVTNENFWVRMLLSYDIGFSEAYMTSEFETPDLKAILELYIDNTESIDILASPLYKLFSAVTIIGMRFFTHGRSKALENVAIYNTSNELYQSFLSQEMMYSCPLWSNDIGGIRGDLEGKNIPGHLEIAQQQKIAYLLAKAQLRPGDRVLEIGCGWGALAIAAAQLGCTVDAVTNSEEQAKLARQRVKLAGVENKVTIHLMDYRDVPPEFEKAFDACLSTEMLEAVGRRYMGAFLSIIDWAVKDGRGSVVLTGATYPERTYTPYQGNDFCRKYHWPEGVSPSPTSFLNDFQTYIPGRFCVDSVADMGLNYPRCLREWAHRFGANWNKEIVQSLVERYPELNDSTNMEVFIRRWRYMFVYMEVGYARRWVGLTCWSLSRPGRASSVCM